MTSIDVVDLVSSDDDSDGDGSEHFYVARTSFADVDDADGVKRHLKDLKGDEAEDDTVERDGACARNDEEATTTSGQKVHHHLYSFDLSYSADGENFTQARGDVGTETYEALARYVKDEVDLTTASDDVKEKVDRLKKAWKEWPAKQRAQLRQNYLKHLEAFVHEFAFHGNFEKARGEIKAPRCVALLELSRTADDLGDLHVEMLKRYKEASGDWAREEKKRKLWAACAQLEEFTNIYSKSGDFEEARGPVDGPRNCAILTLTPKAMTGSLSEIWQKRVNLFKEAKADWNAKQKTKLGPATANHLRTFIQEFTQHGDFRRARGEVSTTRYSCLSKLVDMLPGELSEPYRAQLRLLRSAWAEYTQQQQTTTLTRHRADEDAFDNIRVEAAEAPQEKSLEVKPQREASKRNPKQRMITALEQDRLKAFADSLHEHGDWKRARGESSPMSPKYQTLAKLRRYEKASIPPPLQSAFDKLISCWPYQGGHIKPPDQATLKPKYCSSQSRVDQSDTAQSLVPAKRASSPATTLDDDVDDRATKMQHVDPPSISADADHLIAFFVEYKKHRDFDRARGDKGSERYAALERLNARNGEEFSDPSVCRRVCKLQEMWSSVNYF